MGLHTGEATLEADDYIGLDVHLGARIAAAGRRADPALRGNQVPGRALATGRGVLARPGRHRLKDIEHPEHLFDLVIDGLPAEFRRSAPWMPAPPTSRHSAPRLSADSARRPRSPACCRRPDSSLSPDQAAPARPGWPSKWRPISSIGSRTGVLRRPQPHRGPGLVPSVIAQSLVVREETGRDILDTLADHLRDRRILLVLDNSEQVIEAGPAIVRLLDAAPGLTVLATSRTPFHVSGEHEYQIPPLAVPDPTADLDVVDRSEAGALFSERAAAIRPGFRITSQNAPAVAEITARLDGLPLAIELAASRLNVLSPEAMVDHLGQRLSLLTGGPRDLPHRQRTLRSTIEWSHDLLGAQLQRLFGRLTTFNGAGTSKRLRPSAVPTSTSRSSMALAP